MVCKVILAVVVLSFACSGHDDSIYSCLWECPTLKVETWGPHSSVNFAVPSEKKKKKKKKKEQDDKDDNEEGLKVKKKVKKKRKASEEVAEGSGGAQVVCDWDGQTLWLLTMACLLR